MRETFSKCLEANCKLHEPMLVQKIKDFWDRQDDNLVMNNKFTKQGVSAYWRSMDASFKFNLQRREEYIIRNKFRSMKSKPEDHRRQSQVSRDNDGAHVYGSAKKLAKEDDIPNFFRHTQHHGDRFHWSAKSSGQRFLLPRVNAKSR